MDKSILSVDVPVLLQEYSKLQKAYEVLEGNLRYERELRMSVEKELLLLQEELNTKYKKKKTAKEKELESRETVFSM